MRIIVSNSKQKTFDVGKNIGKFLVGGDIVLLSGDLGSGKTILVKGIASGLGIKEIVTSPTFDILKFYKVPKKKLFFYHIDAYRLNNNDSAWLEEIIMDDNHIVAVEWPVYVKKMFNFCKCLRIKIEKGVDNERKIIVQLPKKYKKIINFIL